VRSAGEILAWIALLFGTVAAAAALYGRYRALPAALTGPAICRLEDHGCVILFRTPLAALLRVPNSLLGLLLYCFVATGLLGHWSTGLLLVGATAALAMTIYLAWRLIRDGLECRICWVGHAANVLLWTGLLWRIAAERR
jgi:uncharacterized membrane protein